MSDQQGLKSFNQSGGRKSAADKARRKAKRKKALKKVAKGALKVGKFIKDKKLISKGLKIASVPAGIFTENPGTTQKLLAASEAAKQLGFGAKKTNPWLVHVKAYRLKHPKLSYKEALKGASKTYTKVKLPKCRPQNGKGIRLAGQTPHPGPRRRRGARPCKPCKPMRGSGLALPGGP